MKEAYEKISRKYKNLPDYKKINEEFEISTIDKKEFLLRGIKRKICERLDLISSVLEKMLHPDPSSPVELAESKCFNTEDRKKIFEIYKKIVLIQKDLLELDLVQDDEKDVDFIRKITGEWPSFRKEVLPFVRKLKNCWKETKETKETLTYFG